MSSLVAPLARAPRLAVLVLGLSSTLACASVTAVQPEFSIQIQAKPPGPPPADLPAVPQPPPPPRVTLEGELLTLDEALSFDDEGQLRLDAHGDIIAELAKFLARHEEILQLSVEVSSVGKGSRRAHKKRSQALAQAIVDALLAQGIDQGRLVAASVGESDDDQRHVVLRVSETASFELEE